MNIETESELRSKWLGTLDPILRDFIVATEAVADYTLPDEQAARFLRFHSFIVSPQPAYITVLRQNPKSEMRWYGSHVDGVLTSVRGGLTAAFYHLSRIKEIELGVNRVLAKKDLKKLGESSLGLSGTRKIDIEYQSFVLASRRCLDYLACSLACYFKSEADSFRRFPKLLKTAAPLAVAEALIAAHHRNAPKLDWVLAEGKKSVRNRISHWEFVSGGRLTLCAEGFFLFGGGENLNLPQSQNGKNLSAALDERFECLCLCVDDMLESFMAAVKAIDET